MTTTLVVIDRQRAKNIPTRAENLTKLNLFESPKNSMNALKMLTLLSKTIRGKRVQKFARNHVMITKKIQSIRNVTAITFGEIT